MIRLSGSVKLYWSLGLGAGGLQLLEALAPAGDLGRDGQSILERRAVGLLGFGQQLGDFLLQ
jgi:hypothetical protein